ncbi:2-hydroxychromene-2-carboxylate isomerase [Massilia sp. erpn]|uniref:2-hydroxychromene-2-carboxylate isomerase n=1 Tax=Massilia sp. erpn TaxID=2738142 RepID=UPI0021048F3D|nr:2-hydroxychromene-2-carboxylate isomerase [Massilia sp. erpn]UTY59259.1 2-hydroxychromene-2-carboxylate isomerase [Massilia sp. erpn]
METVKFYFDPISPFAWLATKQIARIEAAGVRVEMQPILFAAMLNAHGQKGPAEIPAKKELTFRDVMRQAKAQGLRFVGPPGHPFNPLTALRMASAIGDNGERQRFVTALFAAIWEDGLNPHDAAAIAGIADRCGLNGVALLDATGTPAIKQALADNTEQAIAAGIFGVPSFVYQEEIFWGADRIDSLLRRIAGERIDEAQLAAFLAQPPLAQRR